MAAINSQQRVDLSKLPANFSIGFLKEAPLSLKCRQIGYKYFSEGYIHDVKMYSNADENTLNTSAKCYRSQRKSEKPHLVNVDIGATEIVFAQFLSGWVSKLVAPRINGTCSHVVGLVIALQQWQLMGLSDIPAQLSSTSLPQQWTIPRGAKIEPEAVPNIRFLNPKAERKKRPVSNTVTECRKIRVNNEDIAHLKSLKQCPISYLVCTPPRQVDTYLGHVPLASGLSTHAPFFKPKEVQPTTSVCGTLGLPKPAKVTLDMLGLHYHGQFESISQDKCEKLERCTTGQANNLRWKSERKNRLTASNFGEILKRKTVTEKYIASLLSEKSFFSIPTTYGKNNEPKAIEAYMRKTGHHVHDCGLVVNPAFPYLGASPDGKVCDEGKSGLIEIKCPYSARDNTIHDACNLKDFCLEKLVDTISLKTDHNYYYQVQGQLLVTGSDFCDFVVYTKRDLYIQRVLPDVDFMKSMLEKLSHFYFTYIKPKLDTDDQSYNV